MRQNGEILIPQPFSLFLYQDFFISRIKSCQTKNGRKGMIRKLLARHYYYNSQLRTVKCGIGGGKMSEDYLMGT